MSSQIYVNIIRESKFLQYTIVIYYQLQRFCKGKREFSISCDLIESKYKTRIITDITSNYDPVNTNTSFQILNGYLVGYRYLGNFVLLYNHLERNSSLRYVIRRNRTSTIPKKGSVIFMKKEIQKK